MDSADWSSDGLEALKLRLVRSKEDTKQLAEDEIPLVDDFSPTFVYPIFGQEETIFGHKGLNIELQFTSGSLRQYLSVTSSATFPPSSTVKPDDPEKLLYEFIPSDYTKDLDTFHQQVEAEASFQPLGHRVAGYKFKTDDQLSTELDGAVNGQVNGNGKGKGKASEGEGGWKLPERRWVALSGEEQASEEEVSYEMFASTWDTPGFKEFHRRAQLFVLLFIEAASYIDEDDPRWSFVTLFERRKRGEVITYHFIGYVSFYSFFCYPDTKRLRLAQFVLLPPYQGQGHGSALYTLAYQNIVARPEISELTVEDPSEAFEDLRDKADLYTLISSGEFDDLKAPLDKKVTEPLRKKFKLADRQFYRLLEMLLLLQLPPSSGATDSPFAPSAEARKAFRLEVKKRLYIHNKEQLSQVEDEQERKEALQKTYKGVEEGYEGVVKRFRRE